MAKAYWIATYRSINNPEAVAAYRSSAPDACPAPASLRVILIRFRDFQKRVHQHGTQ